MGEAGLPAGHSLRRTGAGNGIRTRDTKLGKLVLYQLSYARSTSIYMKLPVKSQVIFPAAQAAGPFAALAENPAAV